MLLKYKSKSYKEINMRLFSKILAFVFVLILLFILFSKSSDDSVKDVFKDMECNDCNLIIVTVDTLRADHLGTYGYHKDTTPNIDKLAKKGILFSNAYSQSSWTKPSTATLLTGLMPKKHRADTWSSVLKSDRILLSEILKKNGYNTSAFVTNALVEENNGFNQGYDFFTYIKQNESSKEKYAYSDELNDEIEKYLKTIRDNKNNRNNIENGEMKKQFLYIHYTDPHAPYLPKEEVFSKENKIEFNLTTFNRIHEYEREMFSQEMINSYDDEIRFNDKSIGELIDILKKYDIYKNSIIIITSDHGEEFFEHQQLGHGKTLYEEQLRIPLIFHLANRKGIVFNELMNHVDVVPSVLYFLDIKNGYKFDGRNIFNKKNKLDINYLKTRNQLLKRILIP